MDDTFKPDYGTGIGTNIGKLIFGKNSDGTVQKWYILGKDGSISGDNTIIFSDRPIEKEVQFCWPKAMLTMARQAKRT